MPDLVQGLIDPRTQSGIETWLCDVSMVRRPKQFYRYLLVGGAVKIRCSGILRRMEATLCDLGMLLNLICGRMANWGGKRRAKVVLIVDKRASKKSIWRLSTPPKLRAFMWRGCRNSLAVKENLWCRCVDVDNTCALCYQEGES